MTTQHDKAKRWRPRFSIRTLAIFVTLVCCYAACWGPTKRRGRDEVFMLLNDVEQLDNVFSGGFSYGGAHWDAYAVMPLVVEGYDYNESTRHYYFWFFGFVAKLPYERSAEPTPFDKLIEGTYQDPP